MFNIKKCKVKKVWCGNASKPPSNEYSKVGTRVECLRQGFGAGAHTERMKHLPPSSLQRISYVGPDMEANFNKHGVSDQKDLLKKMKATKTSSGKEVFLKTILQNKNATLNGKAYNSVILYLHENGIINLPQCS